MVLSARGAADWTGAERHRCSRSIARETGRSEPEVRRRTADVRQDRVDVPWSGQVVEDPEPEKYCLANNDGGKPGEPTPFDLLLNTNLYSIQLGADRS